MSELKIVLRNGANVLTTKDTIFDDFCEGRANFWVKRNNPLTKVYEEKDYNWIWHESSRITNKCIFTGETSQEKKVRKVVFQ